MSGSHKTDTCSIFDEPQQRHCCNNRLLVTLDLGGDNDPIAVVRECWRMPNEGLSPEFVVVAPGVVQISQVVVKPLPASRFWFVLSAYLGHGIYV